ncbi:MAG: DUF3500 domain-containing protein [Microbacterium sp.]|uniref:DUF3500 domain-containing protein n=1 Tax=Microbacterium sp. TaxID=51671 RepID=UPI0039E4EAA8
MPDLSPLSASVISRRTLLLGIPATALLLAGCTATSTSTSSASATATATATPTATATTSSSSTDVVALAQAFKATLSSDLQSTLQQEYTLSNAERWSNLPQALIGGGPGGSSSSSRIGITLGDLDDTQWASFQTLLQATTGSGSGTGYEEILQHLNADDYLADNGGGSSYGRENFYIAYLGEPSDTGTWEFQFGGHHLAVANTYIDGVLVGATPSFRGIEPNGDFTWDGETDHPMAAKEAAFTALLASLSSDQLATAELSKTYTDLVLAPGNEWAFPSTYEGIAGSALSTDQKELLLAAINGYVSDIADADAARILAEYEADLDTTYLAYSGTTALTEKNDYIRIAGPAVWIEFSMQSGIVLSGNHPHSVWRDRNTDYGGTQS